MGKFLIYLFKQIWSEKKNKKGVGIEILLLACVNVFLLNSPSGSYYLIKCHE